jgi:hypothetical protein
VTRIDRAIDDFRNALSAYTALNEACVSLTSDSSDVPVDPAYTACSKIRARMLRRTNRCLRRLDKLADGNLDLAKVLE